MVGGIIPVSIIRTRSGSWKGGGGQQILGMYLVLIFGEYDCTYNFYDDFATLHFNILLYDDFA